MSSTSGTDHLRNEHKSLCDDFIYNSTTWKRIQVFVDVEIPVRVLLRISDGNSPNLVHISPVFGHTMRESLKAVLAAENNSPSLYRDFQTKISALFDKRKVDIVTKLCLAASMILPKHVYTVDGVEEYNPSGGEAAIIEVIERYYIPPRDQVAAIVQYENFRSKSGIFSQLKFTFSASNSSPNDFWKVASNVSEDDTGIDLFRKLVNGYSGQGESERMNKQVKKFRTTNRNRQTHSITSAYMELDTTYQMIDSRKIESAKVTYIDCIRDLVMEIRSDVADDENDRIYNDLIANEQMNDQSSDDEIDPETDIEIPDHGRSALITLLNSSVTIDSTVEE